MHIARAALLRRGLLALAVTLVLGFLIGHHAEGLAQHSGVPTAAHAETPAEAPAASEAAATALDLTTAVISRGAGLGQDVLDGATPDEPAGHLGLLACALALAAAAVFVRQLTAHDGTVARPTSSLPTPQPAVGVGGREALTQHGVLRI